MRLCQENLLVNIFKFTEGIFDICSQSKDMAEFRNSKGKLEPMTLIQGFTWRSPLVAAMNMHENCTAIFYFSILSFV